METLSDWRCGKILTFANLVNHIKVKLYRYITKCKRLYHTLTETTIKCVYVKVFLGKHYSLNFSQYYLK